MDLCHVFKLISSCLMRLTTVRNVNGHFFCLAKHERVTYHTVSFDRKRNILEW